MVQNVTMAIPPARRRLLKRAGLVGLAAVLLTLTGFLAWTGLIFEAGDEQLAAVRDDPAVTLSDTPDGLVLRPASGISDTGLVFVPGAKVEAAAYAGKLAGLAAAGVTVVITEPPLNLAIADPRPLSTFTALAPDVTVWAVGGHSLGGVKACLLADDPSVDALVLFGSFCANDLSGSSLRVLSIGASEDGLSTPADIEAAAGSLPPSTEFVTIEGANHAAFGDYGPQPGDGTATATSEEVRAELTALLTGFLEG